MTKNLSKEMLKGINALDPSIKQSWQQDNQAWWDWYVTLADNADQYDDGSLVELPPIPNFDVGLDNEIEDELAKPYALTYSQCVYIFEKMALSSCPMFYQAEQWRACERNLSNFLANPLIQRLASAIIIGS